MPTLDLVTAIEQMHTLNDYLITFVTARNYNKSSSTPEPQHEIRTQNAHEMLTHWLWPTHPGEYRLPKDDAVIWNIMFTQICTGQTTHITQNPMPFHQLMYMLKRKRDQDTARTYTGCRDKENNPIYLGDKVNFESATAAGHVIFKFGAYGIKFQTPITWPGHEDLTDFVPFYEIARWFHNTNCLFHTVNILT